MRQLHGKELSFNNLLDLSSARELVEDFDGPACAIVKHNNPCGCADRRTAARRPTNAPSRAIPQSAYGGVIAVNRPVDRAFAQELAKQFIEVLLAPGFDADALELLRREEERAPARAGRVARSPAHEVEGKPVIGGQLVQTRDVVSETREQMRVMTEKAPSEEQWEDLLFAWRVCRHVRSNAIVIAAARRHDRHRRRADEQGGRRADRDREGAGLPAASCSPARRSPPTPSSRSPTAPSWRSTPASRAIVQPGGSVRDEDVVAAADAAGIAMVATDRPPLPPLTARARLEIVRTCGARTCERT